MRLFHFDKSLAEIRNDYESIQFRLMPIARTSSQTTVVCIYLGENGVLARHSAVGKQLFLVVQGEGIVSGRDEHPHHIEAGQAALWESGELHETRTARGLMAIVVEGKDLEPSQFLEELAFNDDDFEK